MPSRRALLVFGLLFLQAFVFTAFLPLVPVFEEELGLTTTQMGAIYGSFGLAALLVSVPAGLLADRLGAVRVAAAAGVVLTVATAGHALAVDFWSLLLSRAALGVGAAAVLPAGIAWLAQATPVERRGTVVGAVMPVVGVGALLGPLVAGFVGGATHRWLPFAAACVATGAVALGLGLAARDGSAAGPSDSGGSRLLRHLGLARRESHVLGAAALVAIAALCESSVNVLAPLQLARAGVSVGTIGIILGGGGVLFIVAGIITAHLAARAVSMGVAALAAVALAVALLPLLASEAAAPTAVGVVLRLGVLGVLWTMAFPLGALGADRTGVGHGSVNGLLLLVIGAANATGAFGGAAVASSLGERWVFAIVAGSALVVATCLFLVSEQLRSERDLEVAASP
jgi:MFS family permease